MKDCKQLGNGTEAYLYETHLHTCEGSTCGMLTAREMVRRFKAAGYTGIVVTDHFIGGNTAVDPALPWEQWVEGFCKGYENARDEGDKIGLQVFFGWESGYQGTEFLVYGLDKQWLLSHPEIRDCSIEEQYALVHADGGIVIHAHPYREEPYIQQIRLFPHHVDAVEAYNATHSSPRSVSHRQPAWNDAALAYAREHNLPVTAGSDQHKPAMIGGGMVFARKMQDIHDLCRGILNREAVAYLDGTDISIGGRYTDMDIPKLLSQMTLREKVSLCTGMDVWHTKAMPRYGIKSIMLCDGPHGLRCQEGKGDILGINKSRPATCFPTAVTAGASWNRTLFAEEGMAIGAEAKAVQVSVVLGPGCNIKRNPLGGRNFEYLSEDPYFTGVMAASYIRGQQSMGVSSCLKHFAVNNQEYKRQNGDSQLDERTLHEIYLTPFEIAVKQGRPASIMCAYNKINGIHASDHTMLLKDILRTQWHFDGAVITDWGAMHNRVEAFRAGCDLNMPGGSRYMEKETLDALQSGQLEQSCVDASVERILRLAERNTLFEDVTADLQKHHILAKQIAQQGAVLLKNQDGLLPAAEQDMVLIGNMAVNMRYQGSGSSHINPTRLIHPADAMPTVPCYPCGDARGNITPEELEEAAAFSAAGRVAVVVVGLPESYESEAFDREHMRLPAGYDALVERVAAVNPNTVVVLLAGGPVEMPWAEQVKAILYMGLPGQAGGEAMADLLTGKCTPCGKLTESWPMTYGDVVSGETFGHKNTEYREGIYVGYRYYDKANKPVRYPFGYGLSYTRFAYSDMTVNENIVTVRVENTGSVKGAEVVQLYVAPPQTGLFRPVRELKGFRRIELEPGESKVARFRLDRRSFALWSDGWKTPGGKYTIQLGASSRDIRLEQTIEVAGEQLPVPQWHSGSWYQTPDGKPSREQWELLMGHPVQPEPEAQRGEFTMDHTCVEMCRDAAIMRLQYKLTEFVISRRFGGKKDMTNPAYRMLLTSATDCPVRNLIISSGGAMTDGMAKLLLRLANGPVRRKRYFRKNKGRSQ